MLEAQYPNGAWPQRYDGVPKTEADFPVLRATIPQNWPREWPDESYSSFYTLNDNTLRDSIRTMLDAHRRTGDARYLDAAKRGGDFLVLAQLPEPQPAWAQQYNARMEPAWARAFEPPAVTAGETAGVIRTLIDLYVETGDEKYREPIPRAIEWLKRSTIAPNRWARYYELGTNKPIYGDRDGRIHYTLEEISEERRTGYGWQGDFAESAIKAWESLLRDGREETLRKRQPKPLSARTRAERAAKAEPAVRKVIAALDEEGRWLTPARGDRPAQIETRTFIANLRTLSDYLALTRDQ
jgi:hypothetical protein